jgi:hypothetical protein
MLKSKNNAMEKKLSAIKNGQFVAGVRKAKLLFIICAGLLAPGRVHAQSGEPGTSDPTDDQTEVKHHKKKLPEPVYPKTVGYLSFIIPVVTVDKNTTTSNFSGTTSIGFPTGINVLYSSRFGFSYEVTPTIKGVNGDTKMSNLLFDPGPMFRFKHGFTIISRLAFETSGRYGFTPVFNQVIVRTKDINYFVALSLPARFGNYETSSLGLNVQFGFIFN